MNSKSFTGVQFWSHSIITEMQKIPDLELRLIKPSVLFSSGYLGHFWEQFILPALVPSNEILLSPANWGPITKKKHVIVIHDVIPYTQTYSFQTSYILASRLLLKRQINRASLILTVSDYSKNQIKKITKKSLLKEIVVVGAASRFTCIPPQKIENSTKYLLFLNSDNPRKNFLFIADMWEEIYKKTGYQLIFTTGRNKNQKNVTSVFSPEWLIEFPNPSDEELATLYSNSTALLFPSLEEGFGLPLLEIMNFGKPFIASETGVAAELRVGRSKILPLEYDEWKNAIIELCESEIKDENLQLERSAMWNWSNVTCKILRAIDSHGEFKAY